MATRDNREELVSFYFALGYRYELILKFLYIIHGVSLSLRQLSRILRKLNLKKCTPVTQPVIERTISAIKEELQGSGALLGYRALWRRLKIQYDIHVPRYVVMKLLAFLAPVESQQRKKNCLKRRVYDILINNRVQTFVWHVDGMDKLKPYGFPIHGCIDGYSRKVLWLQVGTTNNDPKVIAWYYLQCVKQLKGSPRLLRTDLGTENTNISFIHPYLRRIHTDCFADNCFRYGKSVTNQRIEAWWSQLNKKCTRFWIDFFKNLEYNGLLDTTDVVQMDCLRFCFFHLIQCDLLKTAFEWNTHRIRPVRSGLPSGHPDELFFMSELHGSQNYLCNVRARDIATSEEYCEQPDPPGTLEFLEMARELMSSYNLVFPLSIQDALDLYVTMTTILESYS